MESPWAYRLPPWDRNFSSVRVSTTCPTVAVLLPPSLLTGALGEARASSGTLESRHLTKKQQAGTENLQYIKLALGGQLLKIQFVGNINRISRLARAGWKRTSEGEERRQQPAGVTVTWPHS